MLPLRNPDPSGDEESDDEDRIRATRERLRERRKHRNRARHHHHHHPHSHEEVLTSRPRAKSAASTIPPRVGAVAEAAAVSRTRGHSGVAADRKRGHSSAAAVGGVERRRGSSGGGGGAGKKTAGGVGGSGAGSVLVTPIPSLKRWLFSVAAVPWLLLAIVFLVEALEYSRFSSETAGFLEAAETALAALEGKGEGGIGGSGAAAAPKAALKEELARGLVRIYSRHRFVWPFSRL